MSNVNKTMDTKICTACGIPKPITDFKMRSGGYRKAVCSLCNADYFRDYSRRHLEKRLFIGIKYRAKKNNLLFDLKESDINVPEYCPILNIKLIPFSENHNKTIINDSAPTVDRLIPEKGYVKGNVVVISWRANRIKGDGTLQEHKLILEYMRRHEKNKML